MLSAGSNKTPVLPQAIENRMSVIEKTRPFFQEWPDIRFVFLGGTPPVHDAGEENSAAKAAQELELLQVAGTLLPQGLGHDRGNQDSKVQECAQLSSLRYRARLGQVQQ